jgi:hypothetical protein
VLEQACAGIGERYAASIAEAARVKLPSSATCRKLSSCLKSHVPVQFTVDAKLP